MSLLAALFDAPCVSCGGRSGPGRDVAGVFCDRCVRAVEPPPVVPVPAGLQGCRALTAYTGAGRDLVVALKFRGRHAVVPWSAERMSGLLEGCGLDVVTWAPTSRARRRTRGFDQAELLARQLASVLGVACHRCLVRPPGGVQTGRHRDERLHGPVFDARRGLVRAVSDQRVLVVDDVVTTGSTMTAAARVLRQAGAASIVGVAVAYTPQR